MQYKNESVLRNINLQNSDRLPIATVFQEKVGQRGNRGGAVRADCLLRSVSLSFSRPGSISCLVLSISCVSRNHKMPPHKPAMMIAWLEKAKEAESGTVIHSPAALTTQCNEAVK